MPVGAGFVRGVRAVADADPGYIEATLLELGASRRYLAPVAWAAGTLVLVVRGARLLVSNWRLALIELVPAAWVWLVMWDLKRRGLRAPPLRDMTFGGVVLVLSVAIGASIVVFWLNVVFAFAITHERPRIRLAMRQARPFWAAVVRAGAGVGVILTAGLAVIPRIDSAWLYVAAVLGLYGLMLVALVVVPARILGVGKRRLPLRQAVGRWAAGGALSVVAMTPGFVLDRVGVVLLGVPHLQLLGFVLLTVGAAMYAAGLSSVKAIKLSMKLEPAAAHPSSHSRRAGEGLTPPNETGPGSG
jgi:hypothetical protein